MTNNLYFSITELIYFLPNASRDGLKIAHFLIAEFSEVFAFLGYMVYLEILELNFCGFNDNIKRRLVEKGEKEFKNITLTIKKGNDIDSEDEDKNNDEKEKSGYTVPYRNI